VNEKPHGPLAGIELARLAPQGEAAPITALLNAAAATAICHWQIPPKLSQLRSSDPSAATATCHWQIAPLSSRPEGKTSLAQDT